MALTPQLRDLVIRTILGEADPSPEGQAAVANVIKNRALSGAWGDAYNGGTTKVVTAPSQFSVWNPTPKMQAFADKLRAIPTTDARYQRAGQITDAVFNGQIGDNTNGATHYYAPSGMAGGQPPDWARNQQGRQIGTQIFYKLPLTAANTAGTGVTSPSMAPSAPAAAPAATPAATPAAPNQTTVTGAVTPIQAFTGGDYGRTATVNAQPFKGIVVHIAGKPDLQSEIAYNSTPDAGRGNAYYGYHYLIDRDGKVYQTAPDNVRTNHIDPSGGLNNSNAVGVSFIGGAPAGANPLPPTPEQIASGTALINQLKAKYNIDPSMIVSHGELDPATRGKGLNSDGGSEGKDFITAYRANPAGGAAAAATPAAPADANKAAPQAQSVAAVAPPGSAPTPGSPQNPPASSPGAPDANARFQVLTTMGEGGRPGLPYTALNLTPGAGAPAAAPAAAPASAAPAPTPTPTPAPTPAPALAAPTPTPTSTSGPIGTSASTAPIGSPLSSILPTFGSSQPNDASIGGPKFMPGGGARFPTTTPGAPSMGYPALGADTDQPSAPMASMPPPVFASAQNLLKLLFPTIG